MSVAGCGDVYILPPRPRVKVSFHVWLGDLEVGAKGLGKPDARAEVWARP